MTYIARLLETGLLLWLSLLVAIVIGRVLTGRIDVSGLLRHDEDDTGIAPERVSRCSPSRWSWAATSSTRCTPT